MSESSIHGARSLLLDFLTIFDGKYAFTGEVNGHIKQQSYKECFEINSITWLQYLNKLTSTVLDKRIELGRYLRWSLETGFDV
jgi:hypothetical protein